MTQLQAYEVNKRRVRRQITNTEMSQLFVFYDQPFTTRAIFQNFPIPFSRPGSFSRQCQYIRKKETPLSLKMDHSLPLVKLQAGAILIHDGLFLLRLSFNCPVCKYILLLCKQSVIFPSRICGALLCSEPVTVFDLIVGKPGIMA